MARRRPMFSDADREQVSAAITAAEQGTSGEIHCVLAQTSDDYFYPAAFALAAFIIVLGLPLALALHHWWLPIGLATFAAAQLAAFVLALVFVAAFPALRVALVPKKLRYRRAHDNAQKQFLAHNLHMTEGRTGVLIFVSLAERYVEVVADAEIDAKVEQRVWNDAVAGLLAHARSDELAEGFVRAISAVGTVLSEHFPAGSRNRNEIPDRLTEI